jgi:hypothetical protein
LPGLKACGFDCFSILDGDIRAYLAIVGLSP